MLINRDSRGLLRLFVFLLALGCAPFAGAQVPTRNIVFIAIDDLRNWVGYAGDYPGTVHTPNIDALAAVSTRYLSAYTSMPQCVAARTSVMFGQTPATHGLDRVSFGPGDPDYDAIYADPGMISLPEVMADGGYYTAVTGKVFNTPLPARWDSSGPPITYSEFYNAFDPGPDNTFINPQVLDEEEQHPDQVVADWASDFLADYAASQPGINGMPFFLAVGFYQPHLPWRGHQSYYDLYPLQQVAAHVPVPGDLDDVPVKGRQYAAQPLVFNGVTTYEAVEAAGKAQDYTRAYLAAISHTDDMVGQVLAALAASPYAAHTDVILWSDHGFHLGEKFHWRKLTFWEQAVKVPLLVSAPGNPDYPVGDVSAAVSLVDLAPTVLDLAGLPAYSQFEGGPLHDANQRSPAVIYLNGGRATVGSDGMKSVDYDLSQPGLADRESYDLTADPAELVNLIDINAPGC